MRRPTNSLGPTASVGPSNSLGRPTSLPLAAAGLLLACLSGCTSDDTEPNEPAPSSPTEVVDAVFAAVAQDDRDAITSLVREDYIQHSSFAADGRAGLLEALPTLQALEVTVHRRFEDGDRVGWHSTYRFPDGSEQVAFDVFRIQDGQLAEHWDAFTPLVPASETVSGHGMTDGPTDVGTGDTEANRALVVEFVDRVLTQGAFDEITNYISTEQYIQHNPQVGDGIEGVGAFVDAITADGLTFLYTDSPLVVAQGDFVLVGSEGVFGPVEAMPYAVFYDLFRVEDGRIVEHWDAIPASPDPATLPHDNGYF